MVNPRIVISPCSDLPSEKARDARARAWAYVFECFYSRAGKEKVPDDQERFANLREEDHMT